MKISRATLELYIECPLCFYLQLRKKIKRPSGYPFTLNAAVDKLIKAEMDNYRKMGTVPPVLARQGLHLIPYDNPNLGTWRNNLKGVAYEYKGYHLHGAIDDIWVDGEKLIHVADYKCTAKAEPVTELDDKAEHHMSYKRQVEFYTWLLQQNGLPMGKEAYFYYSTGDNTLGAFSDRLEFRTHVIAHDCNLTWIVPTLDELIDTLEDDDPPPPNQECKYCKYHSQRLTI